MKKIILSVLLIVAAFAGKSQNLVPNGGFEQYSLCPTSVAQFANVLFWMNPTGGSPDYFNSCDSAGIVNVPNSYYGYQSANSGSARSGIVVFSGGALNSREYIEAQLSASLVASQCYYFEMYVSLADNFDYMSDAIGVYFSNTAVTGPGYSVLPYTAQIINTTGNFDSTSWRLVSGTYTANGGESYIVIGNFKDDANTSSTLYNPAGTYAYAYVYIDDVSLTPCTGIEEQNNNEAINIYPNPVKDKFTIHLSRFFRENSGFKIKDIKIFDITGRIVLHQTGNLQSSIFNIQSFQSGIYFIEINNGKEVYRKKFLKENVK